jgi:hypothetical protein
MSAARYNLVIDQGSDFAVQFAVAESGTPKDLTGYSARAQLRPSKTSSSLSATFTCTIPSPTDGTIYMSMNNSISAGLGAGTYFYDLEIYTTNDLLVTRLLNGDVSLTQEVTR